MEPPPLLETLLNPDGTETVQPLKAIKDKLGVGNGPLAEVKRFIPPIGQVIALAVLGFMLFILVEIVYFTQVPDALGTGTGSDSDSTGTGSDGGLLGGHGGGLFGGLLGGGGDNDDNSRNYNNYNYYQNNV